MEGPGEPKGALVRANVECVGERPGEFWLIGVSNLTALLDLRLGDIELRPPVLREKLVLLDGGNFSGRGNRGPLSFFRLFSLKNVVVVEIV
jgi:hypothetical protein